MYLIQQRNSSYSYDGRDTPRQKARFTLGSVILHQDMMQSQSFICIQFFDAGICARSWCHLSFRIQFWKDLLWHFSIQSNQIIFEWFADVWIIDQFLNNFKDSFLYVIVLDLLQVVFKLVGVNDLHSSHTKASSSALLISWAFPFMTSCLERLIPAISSLSFIICIVSMRGIHLNHPAHLQ